MFLILRWNSCHKAYCVNNVVNIFEQSFSMSAYNYKGKLSSFRKKMFIESEIQNNLGCKKSIFWWRTFLKSTLKSLKIYMGNFNGTIFNRLEIMGFLQINGNFISTMPFLMKLLQTFSLFRKNLFYQMWTLQSTLKGVLSLCRAISLVITQAVK